MMLFERDIWNEIWVTLTRNKLRTALTAFGVSWGLFMLMIMLGASNGLENGVSREFAGRVSNSVVLWSQSTSIAYEGFQKGRRVEMNNDDAEAIQKQVESVDVVSPGLQLGGWRGANNVTFDGLSGAFEINGYYPNALKIKLLQIPLGRFINNRDIEEKTKVCVVGKIVRDQLFKGANPIGEYINIQGVNFRVVGQFNSGRSGDDAEDEDRSIYIPFSTFQHVFNQGDKIGWLVLTSKAGYPASKAEADVKKLLMKRHHIHPEDVRAFGSWNLEQNMQRTMRIFVGIEALSWFVGVLTLIAGIIGISNIMLVIIKERTREIGIQRALGSTPIRIVSQVVLESLTLTAISGIIGFLAGVYTIELAGKFIAHDFFTDPEINLNIALTALTILIISGALAGVIPASRALRIKPIEALRTE